MSWFKPSSLFEKVFEGGLLIKGLDGFIELVAGFILLFVSPASIQHFLSFITARELQSEPNNKFAHLVLHSADHLTTSNKTFLIIYLWLHASIKLISVVGILKNWLWAYPFALISLGILTLYQVYSIVVHASIGMILLTIFDVFILGMIWREYGFVKNKRSKKLEEESKPA
ncbi:MAG: DUF2127 domain-containing protein [Candidatus Saccharimonadales bacterium]